MIKYFDTAVVFQEIPNQITLAVDITNCPHHCKNCHSPYLSQDIGQPLSYDQIDLLIKKNNYINCFCFMGGDSNHSEIINLCRYIKRKYPNIKTAMYSGDDYIDIRLLSVLDFYKIGRYDEKLGGLKSATTQQLLFFNSGKSLYIINEKLRETISSENRKDFYDCPKYNNY